LCNTISLLSNITKVKVESRNHFKNGADPKSLMSKKSKIVYYE
jgi:hypothetical protein